MSQQPLTPMDVDMTRRLRGEILKLVYENHRAQKTRLDDALLWSVLRRLMFDVNRNQVLTLIQDLGERGYLHFAQQKDDYTGRVWIRDIQILPTGRDLVEGSYEDPGVALL